MTLISNAVLCFKWSFGAIYHYSQDCLNEAAIFSMKEVMSTCFPGGSGSKEFACSEGGPGLIPGSGRPPEKGMATHSSVLAWRIPRTEEPGELQSTESQRIKHD